MATVFHYGGKEMLPLKKIFDGKRLLWLSALGYRNEDISEEWKNGHKYAKEIQNNWDSSVSSLAERFKDDTNLVFMPKVDTGKVTDMSYCFYNCSNLTAIPLLDTGKVTDMSYCFSDCSELTSIPELDTSNVTDMEGYFFNCFKLKRIEGVSFKKLGKMDTVTSFFWGAPATYRLRYILIKDIGTNPDCTIIDATYVRGWGIDNEDVPDARQSLIDSLLTYSFDRASAGYSDCTIKLHTDVKEELTEDEINSIQAKGYIIS